MKMKECGSGIPQSEQNTREVIAMTVKDLKSALETVPDTAEIAVKDPVFGRFFFKEITPKVMDAGESSKMFADTGVFGDPKVFNNATLAGNAVFAERAVVSL